MTYRGDRKVVVVEQTTGTRRRLGLLAAVVLAGGATLGAAGVPSASAVTATSVPPACSNPVATWSVAQRLEQLMMVSGQFSDLGASASAAAAGVGGFVFFGQPAAGSGPAIAAGIAGLTADAGGHSQIVPFMSTDEEGGLVARLSNVIGALPTPRQMAATLTTAQVRSLLFQHGAAMKSLGITMDLAPVLDTASPTDPYSDESDRSFSETPQVTAAYGTAFSAGLESAGIVPVANHFPGLGHAVGSTDTGTATDPPLSTLETEDLVSFGGAISNGAPVVMVGHPIVPNLTGGLPASLSPATYSLLRQNLLFQGLTMTDALGAGAISDAGFSEQNAAVAAEEAGADMVLVDAAWQPTLTALEQAVNSGALSLTKVDASVTRVLKAKAVPTSPAVSMAATPAGTGYWIAGSGGGVSNFGGVGSFGSLTGVRLNQPVVGMSSTSNGGGYWLVASDGGVFSFGNAQFYGSTGGIRLARPVVGMATGPPGRGYWLVASDGGVLASTRPSSARREA
jgi:beta-N-acetylhexosaminidase